MRPTIADILLENHHQIFLDLRMITLPNMFISSYISLMSQTDKHLNMKQRYIGTTCTSPLTNAIQIV